MLTEQPPSHVKRFLHKQYGFGIASVGVSHEADVVQTRSDIRVRFSESVPSQFERGEKEFISLLKPLHSCEVPEFV